MVSNVQQYCLRWNNHRSNLLTVFEELLQNEAFTDVTLVCDNGNPIKCHRMVLAACSQYFQNIFTDLPCTHPIVVLKDVKYIEIKAILEYMYRGEVNVAQDQLGALLQIAETLKVKGLIEENRTSKMDNVQEQEDHLSEEASPSSTNIQSTAHINSPPHSTNEIQFRAPYNIYSKAPQIDRNSRNNIPMWSVSGHPIPYPSQISQQSNSRNAATAGVAMLHNCHEASNSEMNLLKRKKNSSLLMDRDNPILRTVLGQADSSQPVSMVYSPDKSPHTTSNNLEESPDKFIKNEPYEDAQSPCYNSNLMTDDEENSKLGIPFSGPHVYSSDMRTISSIATYVPGIQRPENKRYKKYAPSALQSAIEAVKNGMSALKASKRFDVPSRTVYDKVKKMGIVTSRPFKKGPNDSDLCYSFGLGGTDSSFEHFDTDHLNNSSSLMEANNILQQVLDNRGRDGGGRESLAAAAAAHASISHRNISPNNNNHDRSPVQSQALLKYMRLSSNLEPSPVSESEHTLSETNGSSERDREEDEDQVEDLSVNRKQESRVIMSPMSISSIMKKEEMLKESLREEMRREIKVENAE